MRAVAGDDRLARQAIDSFERSRRSEGITYSRYPSAPQQFIPPLSPLWVGMVHDDAIVDSPGAEPPAP